MITTRCCRASYGILCNREYDEKNATHLNRPTYVDPLDGKRYVTNMIQWFIRKACDNQCLYSTEHKLIPLREILFQRTHQYHITSIAILSREIQIGNGSRKL